MPAPAQSAAQLADSVRSDTSAPTSTTTQTLNVLRAILGLELQETSPRTSVENARKTPARKPPPKTKPTAKAAQREGATQFAIHEATAHVPKPLDLKGRKKLATETFNTTLKTLSKAAREKQQEKTAVSIKPSTKAQCDNLPLQTSTANGKAKVAQPSKPAEKQLEYQTTAQCASVALNCLRRLHQEAHVSSPVDDGLENGALVLLDKSITLELTAEAEIQSQQLHQQYWNKRQDPKTDQPGADALSRICLASEDTASRYNFVTSLQGQLLRLAILQGPALSRARFTKHVRPETEGSPVCCILVGHSRGFLDSETTGQQLRTISLALSKLHATITHKRPLDSAQALEALELGTIALQVKCMSWKFLDHKPDILKELWLPFSKLLEKASRSKDVSEFQKKTEQCMAILKQCLLQHQFRSNIPSNLRQYCSAEERKSHKTEDAVQLESSLRHLKKDDPQRLLIHFQLCLAELTNWKEETPSALSALQRCIEAVSKSQHVSQDTDTVLIAMAQLRKAAISAADEILTLQNNKVSNDVLNELHVACVRLVFAFLSHCHQSEMTAAAEMMSSSAAKSKAGVLLSYAKTIESIFHCEQYPAAHSALLDDETNCALDESVTFARACKSRLDVSGLNPGVSAFLLSVPVRVSYAFWSRYLKYTEEHRPVAVKVEVLSRSIKAVQGCSLDERKSATIGVKHEKLSALWLEQKSFSKAQSSLTAAIEFAIEQGTLAELVNAISAQPSGQRLDDTKTASWRIHQTLAKYVALSLNHNVPNSKGTWYYDSHRLEDLERAKLLEIQIVIALDQHAMLLKKEQLKSLLKVWEQLCSEPKNRAYQLRTMSQMLHSLGKCEQLDATDVLGSLPIVQQLLSETVPNETTLYKCSPLIAALLAVQWAFASGSMNEHVLNSVSTQLQGVLADCIKNQTFRDVPDAQILLVNLGALADYAAVLGLRRIQLEAVEACLKLLDLRMAPNADKKLAWLLTAAAASTVLGQTVVSGRALAASEKLAMDGSLDQVRWSLGCAEYHFSISNVKRSTELLIACRDCFDVAAASSPRDRLEKETLLCHATYLASRLALQQGDQAQAMRYARQAVKLSSGIWTSLEKTLSASSSPDLVAHDTTLSGLAHDLSTMTLDSKARQIAINHSGAKYWDSLGVHRSILRHFAQISAHNGLYQDALHFAQQAVKITAWTGGKSLRHCAASELALIYASAQQARPAEALFPAVNATDLDPLSAANFGEACLRLGRPDDAQKFLKVARLDSSPSQSVKENVSQRKQITARRVKAGPKPTVRKTSTKAVATRGQVLEDSSSSAATTNIALKEFQARLNALTDEIHLAHAADIEAVQPTDLTSTSPIEVLSRAAIFVHQAMKHFAADPAKNAVAETALALPVRYRSVRKSGQMSLLLESPVKLNSQPPSESATTGDALLQQAYEWLRMIEGRAISVLSTAKVEFLHEMLSRVVLLSTALSRPLSYSPLNIVLQSFRPKDAARYREQCVIKAERENATREQTQTWPSLHDAQNFQRDYSDLMQELPESWTVLSIGLSNDGKEMLLSKLLAGRTPFLMRVPLERPGVDSGVPCEFALDDAKEELRDIIQKANETSHDSRGQGDRQARKAWYAEREHLDKRLELLLANIENIWLGGFRGLLSPNSPDQTLLARFGESLKLTLERHLPSRQKKAKTKNKVDLHAHVLELFTSVVFEEGDADFEDSITDLLYFVVDVLQFNGEPNAFDEVDFDAMLVDTIDALRGYHAEADNSSQRHTILVIDKELQAFPWESLPCLRGQPASRMPSLSAIKARLDRMRSDVFTIPRSGAYMLNPSGDLTNTQATFSPLLSQLSFQAITGRPPSEAEFEHLLAESEILLYFGHGAGTQYIRGRTIRKLSQCPVTWLMGCSSARLTECGLYESYGVPWHYMHAGSAAVVGTLWDVTDRDIDRFAVRALGSWGLLDIEEVDEKFWGSSKSKGKGKGIAKASNGQGKGKDGEGRAVPLDEAVAGARDACLLRYLNGAAPVVYGVPVMLK